MSLNNLNQNSCECLERRLKKQNRKVNVNLKVYKGVLGAKSQYLIEITDQEGLEPVYYRYADLMDLNNKKLKDINRDLMNQYALSEAGLVNIQYEIRKLVDDGEIEKIDEYKTKYLLGLEEYEAAQDEIFSKSYIHECYEKLVKYIIDNKELFPVRDLTKDLCSSEGFVVGKSMGVYIDDLESVQKYKGVVVAISRDVLRNFFSEYTEDTKVYREIVKRLMIDKYFIDTRTSSSIKEIKVRHTLLKRMYLVCISNSLRSEWRVD